MAAESLHRREQRRVLGVVLAAAVLVLVVAVPLVVSDELRLRLAHEFGLAPGEGVPRLVGADDRVDLLVAPVMQPDPRTERPARTLVALYIARTEGDGVTLQDLNASREIRLPIAAYDHVAAAPDAGTLLFVEGDATADPRAVVVTVQSGQVTALPAGQRRPDASRHWDVPLWESVSVRCEAISPALTYVACLDPPEAAHYLAGDWEIQVQAYGDFQERIPVFRGRGFLPIAGWTVDEGALYFQNEQGLWRVDVSPQMFDGG